MSTIAYQRKLPAPGGFSKGLVYQTSTNGVQRGLSQGVQGLYDKTVDAAFLYVANFIGMQGLASITVVDPDGIPIPKIKLQGLKSVTGETAVTDDTGTAVVVCVQETEVTLSSDEFIDLQTTTVTIVPDSTRLNKVTVTMPWVEKDSIVTVLKSRTVKFWHYKTIDICCVSGGNGGGSANLTISGKVWRTTYGGGGGAIVNSFGKNVSLNTEYDLVVGFGGAPGTTATRGENNPGSVGGVTSFLGVIANPGNSYLTGGPGGGNGGYETGDSRLNATVKPLNNDSLLASGAGAMGRIGGTAEYPAVGGTPNGGRGRITSSSNYATISQGSNGIAPGGGGGGGSGTNYVSSTSSSTTLTFSGYAGAAGGVFIQFRGD